MTYDFLHPEIFGPGYFDSEFKEILSNMSEDNQQQKEAKQYMRGIQSQINAAARNQLAIDQLGIFLTEIDRRRNLNWRLTFPWLVKELSNVVQ